MHSLDQLASITVDCGFHIHNELGPGLLESVYEVVLAQALVERGLSVVRQQPIAIAFRGLTIPDAFRADIIVDDRLIVEIKSTEKIHPVHSKQLLTYLRLTKQPLGLLINFGCTTFREGVKRVANGHKDLGAFAPWREK